MSAAREKLATAISNYHDAVAAADKAKETLEKATAFVADLERQVGNFKALDKEIAASRAASIERALTAGETPSLEASPELSAELVKKHDAENRLSSARQAVGVLEEKFTAADAAAKRADLQKERSAAEVLASEAETLAASFSKDFEDLRRRYFILQTMTAQRIRIDPQTLPADMPSYLIRPDAHIDFAPDVSKVVGLASALGAYDSNSPEQIVRDGSARAAEEFFAALKGNASATIEDYLL
ncbi:hypothetical protein CCR94_01990 [Rhodoblastus sphagnicola]|uniref:Uncharacterized protein n=1 Tax=Rhodoblastus sphagnicola TaxID=333368 RepID=A0A2S6NFH7_9HYPH|nr:hypothetical protein [Rhodoblastus sphagnicola]MBB4199198.1 hypothetical protein [Rhodoblastus sphagnicola]PPQ33392.1 hypothetical protein CCR94_01990 [Rhodoblastus sphagnicola]